MSERSFKIFNQLNNNTLILSNQCCRTFNISAIALRKGTPQEYFPYKIATEPGCPTPLNELARLKTLAQYGRPGDQRYCLILWTCRPSRQGLHAFCNTQIVDAAQQRFIDQAFQYYEQPQVHVLQTSDYRDSKCFPDPVTFQPYFWRIFKGRQ